MAGKILTRKLEFEKMIHNNFVVLNEICHRLKLMYILISETRCIFRDFLRSTETII
jgi:hypothetical protein